MHILAASLPGCEPYVIKGTPSVPIYVRAGNYPFRQSRGSESPKFGKDAQMTAFDDSTTTNTSLLCLWAYRVLRPIVRVLRSAGVSEGQMIECIQRASTEHSGDAVNGQLGSGTRRDTLSALAEVTALWARSPQWTDATGRPRELSLRTDDPQGFGALMQASQPQLSPRLALEQLAELKVVRLVRNDQCARLLTHVLAHTTEGAGAFPVEATLADLRRHAETIEHNVFRSPGDISRMQMIASRLSLDPARFEDFMRFVRRTGQSFLESADDMLATYVTQPHDHSAQFGVGVYVFCDDTYDGRKAD